MSQWLKLTLHKPHGQDTSYRTKLQGLQLLPGSITCMLDHSISFLNTMDINCSFTGCLHQTARCKFGLSQCLVNFYDNAKLFWVCLYKKLSKNFAVVTDAASSPCLFILKCSMYVYSNISFLWQTCILINGL